MSVLVDTVQVVEDVIRELITEDEVAVGVEGTHLCRDGTISVIQVCPKSTMARHATYLFDVTTLGAAVFEYGLQDLLESESVRKVMFDGRSANDALYHNYGFKMLNVYSLQVLHMFKFPPDAARQDYLASFKKCLDMTRVVRDPAAQERIIERGKRLYAPEKGGSYTVWDARPLHPDLVQHCAASVKHLLPVHLKWRDPGLDGIVELRSRERIEAAINRSTPAKGHQLSRRDFPLGPSAGAGGADTPAVPVECAICMELLSTGWKDSVEVRCLPCSHAFHAKCINGYVRKEHASLWRSEGVQASFIDFVTRDEGGAHPEEPAAFAQWFSHARRRRVKCPLCRQLFPPGRALAASPTRRDAAS